MKRSVVIHQPDFLPWLGFFDRLLKADLFIVLDHVQFSRRGWTHRDCIKTAHGSDWVTLNIRKAPRDAAISEIMLSADETWKRSHLNLISENYRNSPFYEEIFPFLEKLYALPIERMAELTAASIEMLESMLDAKREHLLSSEMSPEGKSTSMLLHLLKKAGATHYISGLGARAYLDTALLSEAGIETVWQDFRHPIYPQQHGPFIPMLSSIDALFNCGVPATRDLLRGN